MAYRRNDDTPRDTVWSALGSALTLIMCCWILWILVALL